jgi:hypothetical protein
MIIFISSSTKGKGIVLHRMSYAQTQMKATKRLQGTVVVFARIADSPDSAPIYSIQNIWNKENAVGLLCYIILWMKLGSTSVSFLIYQGKFIVVHQQAHYVVSVNKEMIPLRSWTPLKNDDRRVESLKQIIVNYRFSSIYKVKTNFTKHIHSAEN